MEKFHRPYTTKQQEFWRARILSPVFWGKDISDRELQVLVNMDIDPSLPPPEEMNVLRDSLEKIKAQMSLLKKETFTREELNDLEAKVEKRSRDSPEKKTQREAHYWKNRVSGHLLAEKMPSDKLLQKFIDYNIHSFTDKAENSTNEYVRSLVKLAKERINFLFAGSSTDEKNANAFIKQMMEDNS